MMEGLFRKIAIYLCKPIYCLIVYMYKIFYNIATTRFLQSEIVQEISANIYTLVSVVMLFAFSVTILSAIVNPDLLSDGKKGVKAVFKRAIIALMLIVVIPFAFDELYKIQETIMKNSLIEKIVVGIEYNCNSSDKSKCEAGGNGGQVIAGTLMSAVLYPDDEMADADGNVNVSVSVSEYYSKMIAEDLPKYIGAVAKNINATAINPENANISNDEAYAFKFNGLIAIVVGLVTVYILVIFAIDVAVRVFKMAFMELTAPISIVSYVAAGDKILSSWFKELGKTYAELFVRVAAIAFYLFLVSNLSSFMEQFKDSDWTLVLKAFLMVGMLIFAKQVPDMIGKIFGVEIKSQGGIAGRLGNMAGVGNVAKKAWEAVRNPIAAGAGIASAGGALAARFNAIRKNSNERANKLRAAGAGKGRIFADRLGTYAGGLLTMPASTVRAFKNGITKKNLQSIGAEANRYENTHPEGSTFGGRIVDSVRSATGFESRADARIAELDRQKAVIDAEVDYNSSIQKFSKAISDAVKNSIESATSSVNFNINAGNGNYRGTYSQIQERINAEKQAAAQIIVRDANGNVDTAQTQIARDTEFRRIALVEQAVSSQYKRTKESLTTQALSSNTCPSDIKDTDYASIKEAQSQLSVRGVQVSTNGQLKAATDAASEKLYTNANSLTEQASRNEEQRRERNANGDFTEQGRRVQDSNAVKARNNDGASTNKK